MLVLPVQLDQTPGEILERAGRGERAVDEGAAASLGRDFAANQQLLPAAVEDRFDGRRVLAGPHEVARRSPAEQQADGFDQNRLAGAGFARQDVQARVEFDLDRVDDGEVPDAKEAEHDGRCVRRTERKGKNSNRNIGLTALSHHDTVSPIALSQRRTH